MSSATQDDADENGIEQSPAPAWDRPVRLRDVVAALTERDDDGQIVGGWSAAAFLVREFS